MTNEQATNHEAGDEAVPGRTVPVRKRRGSLAGELKLTDGWDSPEVNAQIAADFELS